MSVNIALFVIGVVIGVLVECIFTAGSQPMPSGYVYVNFDDPEQEAIEIHFTKNFLSEDQIVLDVIHKTNDDPDIPQG